MQCMETVVAVLFPDTSLRQKCWDIRCQWLLCIGRLVCKHKHVMLDCTLGKTGSKGVDHWRSFTTGQWGQTQAQAFCMYDWVCFYLGEAHIIWIKKKKNSKWFYFQTTVMNMYIEESPLPFSAASRFRSRRFQIPPNFIFLKKNI